MRKQSLVVPIPLGTYLAISLKVFLRVTVVPLGVYPFQAGGCGNSRYVGKQNCGAQACLKVCSGTSSSFQVDTVGGWMWPRSPQGHSIQRNRFQMPLSIQGQME